MIFTKIAKSILKIFIFSLLLIVVYLSIAYTLTFFPSATDTTAIKSEKVYILYNEMHSDIIIDIDSLKPRFKAYLSDIIQNREGYLAFGWGDRETYLNTPRWSDIKLSTTLKALFINTPSVVHINFFRRVDNFRDLKIIYLSKEQKKELIKSIFKSFKDKNYYKGYGRDDLFYPSLHRYNLFNTCNTWTGDRLRDANISISYWTPLSYNVIKSLP